MPVMLTFVFAKIGIIKKPLKGGIKQKGRT